jgi:hypothetical protein
MPVSNCDEMLNRQKSAINFKFLLINEWLFLTYLSNKERLFLLLMQKDACQRKSLESVRNRQKLHPSGSRLYLSYVLKRGEFFITYPTRCYFSHTWLTCCVNYWYTNPKTFIQRITLLNLLYTCEKLDPWIWS